MDAMFDCVVLVDDNLAILWTNKVTKHFGMSTDELKGNIVMFSSWQKQAVRIVLRLKR